MFNYKTSSQNFGSTPEMNERKRLIDVFTLISEAQIRGILYKLVPFSSLLMKAIILRPGLIQEPNMVLNYTGKGSFPTNLVIPISKICGGEVIKVLSAQMSHEYPIEFEHGVEFDLKKNHSIINWSATMHGLNSITDNIIVTNGLIHL